MTENERQMMQTELEKFISGLLFRSFSAHEKLVTDRLLDSINIVELVVFIEAQVRIKISPFEMTAENFDTLESIMTLIQSKKGTKV